MLNMEDREIELLVFGYQSRLFNDPAMCKRVNDGSMLIPWQGDDTNMMDKHDARLLVDDKAILKKKKRYKVDLSMEEFQLMVQCDGQRYFDLDDDPECRAGLIPQNKSNVGVGALDFFERPANNSLNSRAHKTHVASEDATDNYTTNNNSRGDRRAAIAFTYTDDDRTHTITTHTPAIHAEDAVSSDESDLEEEFSPALALPAEMVRPKNHKQLDVIFRTARFLSAQSLQMEIVLKAKQQHNRRFLFLTYGNPLNPFYKHVLAMIRAGTYTPPEIMKPSSGTVTSSETPTDQTTTTTSTTQPTSTMAQGEKSKSTLSHAKPLVCYSEDEGSNDENDNNDGGEDDGDKSSVDKAPDNKINDITPITSSANEETQPTTDTDPQPIITTQTPTWTPIPVSTPIPTTVPQSMSNVSVNVSVSGASVIVHVNEPPPAVKVVITKLAKYVAKNGRAFGENVRQQRKDDPRFSFLQPWDEYYGYYMEHLKAERDQVERAMAIETSSANNSTPNTNTNTDTNTNTNTHTTATTTATTATTTATTCNDPAPVTATTSTTNTTLPQPQPGQPEKSDSVIVLKTKRKKRKKLWDSQQKPTPEEDEETENNNNNTTTTNNNNNNVSALEKTKDTTNKGNDGTTTTTNNNNNVTTTTNDDDNNTITTTTDKPNDIYENPDEQSVLAERVDIVAGAKRKAEAEAVTPPPPDNETSEQKTRRLQLERRKKAKRFLSKASSPSASSPTHGELLQQTHETQQTQSTQPTQPTQPQLDSELGHPALPPPSSSSSSSTSAAGTRKRRANSDDEDENDSDDSSETPRIPIEISGTEKKRANKEKVMKPVAKAPPTVLSAQALMEKLRQARSRR